MRSKAVLLLVFTIGAFIALVVPMAFITPPLHAVAASMGSFVAYFLLCEILFRIVYYLRCGHLPEHFKRIPFDQLHIEPHPYMPFAYKQDFSPSTAIRKNRDADYPLHKGRFQFMVPHFNNFRLQNGPDGRRDIRVPKPEGTYRILCLGGSTTGNYIEENGKPYSYPSELEKELAIRHPDRTIEVVNGGMGGRTSAEVLIHFMLSLVDTDPDAVVIYHAYNDLGPSLTPGFQSDYSHARKGLGEAYNLYRIRAAFPDLPFAMYNYVLNLCFPGNLSNALIETVTAQQPDMNRDFQGTETYKRNLKHVIDICKARGIKVFCTSYCSLLYPEIADSLNHQKYQEGLTLENNALRHLAQEESIPFIDAATIMPSDNEYFVDSIHLSPKGMQELARIIANNLALD